MSASACCTICGAVYDPSFQVTIAGLSGGFDRAECALRAIGRSCDQCGARVPGAGIARAPWIFCSAHCANAAAAILDRLNAKAADPAGG